MSKEKTGLPAIVQATRDALAKFPEGEFNRLFPTETILENLGQFQAPRVETIRINPDKDSGDVYFDRRVGKPALTKTSLDRIAHAGGVQIHPTLSGFEVRDRTFVRYKAVGLMKKADGTPLVITRTKEIDLELEREKIEDAAIRKADEDGLTGQKRKDYIDGRVRRDFIQLRENVAQMAESKAINRVIRAAFAIKSSYTVAELSKPFVLIRFDTFLDPNDPAIRKALAERATAATAKLFPAGPDFEVSVGEAVADGEVEAAVEIPLETALDESPQIEDQPDPRMERIGELQRKDLGELKDLFIAAIRSAEYDTEADESNFVLDWQKTNDLPPGEKVFRRAHLVYEAEAYRGRKASE